MHFILHQSHLCLVRSCHKRTQRPSPLVLLAVARKMPMQIRTPLSQLAGAIAKLTLRRSLRVRCSDRTAHRAPCTSPRRAPKSRPMSASFQKTSRVTSRFCGNPVTQCNKGAAEGTAAKEATVITTAGKAHCQALQYGFCDCKHGCYMTNGDYTVGQTC